MFHKRFFKSLLLFFLFFGIATCTSTKPLIKNTVLSSTTNLPLTNSTNADSQLKIWWNQGFLPEENEFITQIVDEWKQQNNIDVELSLIADRNINQETRKAIDAGKTPDIVFNFTGDLNLFPRLAWENKLADVSELIEPIKDSYLKSALEAVSYQNNVTNKRSYYAVPLAQQALHTSYWKDLLEEAGLGNVEIPKEWDAFWTFWKEAQDTLHQKGQEDIYGLGLVMSSLGADTFWQFEHFLEAYNVELIDKSGQLRLDAPGIEEGITTALDQFTRFYKDGYVPPDSVDWTDSGNNVALLDRHVIMTANPSVSIPLTQKQDEENIYNKLSTDLYFNKMATTELPNKPNKEPMRYLISVKQVVLFENSTNKDVAKKFLSYLLEPDNLNRFLKEANKGRIFPVMPELLKDSFWNNPSDPHLFVAAKQYKQPVRPFYPVLNPAYVEVQSQNIWAKAILSILQKGASPEQAADQAIAQIKQIFAEWK